MPYTYNFQDNGGALGLVTVTNTGAPTERRTGCYMSDWANNHAGLSHGRGVEERERERGTERGSRERERGLREREGEEEEEEEGTGKIGGTKKN